MTLNVETKENKCMTESGFGTEVIHPSYSSARDHLRSYMNNDDTDEPSIVGNLLFLPSKCLSCAGQSISRDFAFQRDIALLFLLGLM